MKWLKKHFSTILIVLVLLFGVSLLAYPTVSDLWNDWHQSKVIDTYGDAASHMSQADYDAEMAAALAYNQSLIGNNSRFLWRQEGEEWDEYCSMLDITGNGSMGYIEIPKIDVKLPVYHGTDENVLQVAVGHVYGTSLPVGGMGTHCVLSGHTGLPSASLFTDLTQLDIGDKFAITTLGTRFVYQVDQIKVVLPDDTTYLQIDREQDYCTLLTCTPYGVNSHRLLVRGVRVDDIVWDESDSEHSMLDWLDWYMDFYAVAIAGAVAAIVLLIIVFVLRRNGRKIRKDGGGK